MEFIPPRVGDTGGLPDPPRLLRHPWRKREVVPPTLGGALRAFARRHPTQLAEHYSALSEAAKKADYGKLINRARRIRDLYRPDRDHQYLVAALKRQLRIDAAKKKAFQKRPERPEVEPEYQRNSTRSQRH